MLGELAIISKRANVAESSALPDEINQILAINYINEPTSVRDELRVNLELGHEVKIEISNFYKDYYLKNFESEKRARLPNEHRTKT